MLKELMDERSLVYKASRVWVLEGMKCWVEILRDGKVKFERRETF